MRIQYNKIIGYVFEHLCNTKNIKGTINECLIAGNLAKYGYEVIVNNVYNIVIQRMILMIQVVLILRLKWMNYEKLSEKQCLRKLRLKE